MWNAAVSAVWPPKVANKVVDNFKVLQVVDVGGEYVSWYPGVVGYAVEKSSLDFVKALLYVGRSSGEVCFVESSMFNVDGGGVPGIGGTDTWYAGEHVVGGPGVDPWFEIVKASAGPEAVCGRGDEERAVGQGIVRFVGVFFKVRSFSGEHALGPGGATFDFVVYLREPDKTEFTEELEVGSVPVV